MNVTDIFEQAKALSMQDRKELVKLLVDTFDEPSEPMAEDSERHWGHDPGHLFVDPETEDPVE